MHPETGRRHGIVRGTCNGAVFETQCKDGLLHGAMRIIAKSGRYMVRFSKDGVATGEWLDFGADGAVRGRRRFDTNGQCIEEAGSLTNLA